MSTSRTAHAPIPPSAGPRVLVIGAGFIGSRLAAHLVGRGISTTVLTRTAPSGLRLGQLHGAHLLSGDAADPAVLEAAVAERDHVVYCAGGLLPADSVRSPGDDLALSLTPVLSTLEALRRHPGTTLCFLSSGGTIYGQPRALPVAEDHPTDPITAYGVSKLAAEKYIGMYAHLYGIPARILRFANVYGPGQPAERGQGAVAAFLHSALRRRPVTLFGDGTAVRDFIHVDDSVRVIAGLLGRFDAPSVLNVGSGQATTIAELVEIVSAVTGRPLLVEQRHDRPFDVHHIVLDTSRLRATLRFSPVSIQDGVQQTWDQLVDDFTATAAGGSG